MVKKENEEPFSFFNILRNLDFTNR